MNDKIIFCALFLSLPLMALAQKHDREKYLQWRSMEKGPIDYSPALYYYTFHKSYSGYHWKWEWHGFKSGLRLRIDESKAKGKPVLPKRVEHSVMAELNHQEAEDQEKDMKARQDAELLKAADRTIDAAWILYKSDFDRIGKDISYCLLDILRRDPKSALVVNEYQTRYLNIKEGIAVLHQSHVENAKRQEGYMAFQKKLEKLRISIISYDRMLIYGEINQNIK